MDAPGTCPSVELSGGPFERGRQQAERCPEAAELVRAAVRGRLGQSREALRRKEVRAFLAAQRAFSAEVAPEALDEVRGISEGFALEAEELFAYLHLGAVADLAAPAVGPEGCTAWAMPDPEHGCVVGKNRDFRGEHLGLQRVFRHRDPGWGGREVLCVGSLGSPGAYSSGLNSDGLVVVDTNVATTEHGPGWLRYFLMSRLLARCRSVAEALAVVAAARHAGGGTLVIGDREGAVAAIELGHPRAVVEAPGRGWVARTNHFTAPALAAKTRIENEPMGRSSARRLAVIGAALGRSPRFGLAEAKTVMAGHGTRDGEALCRHGEDRDAITISCSLFLARSATLQFSAGPPCEGRWQRHRLG